MGEGTAGSLRWSEVRRMEKGGGEACLEGLVERVGVGVCVGGGGRLTTAE